MSGPQGLRPIVGPWATILEASGVDDGGRVGGGQAVARVEYGCHLVAVRVLVISLANFQGLGCASSNSRPLLGRKLFGTYFSDLGSWGTVAWNLRLFGASWGPLQEPG